MQGINGGKFVGAMGAAKLINYYTKNETYNKEEIDALLEQVIAGEIDLSSYATKEELAIIEQAISNKSDSSHTHIIDNIDGLSAELNRIESELSNNINTISNDLSDTNNSISTLESTANSLNNQLGYVNIRVQALESIDHSVYLTEHQDLSGYVTNSDFSLANEKILELGENITLLEEADNELETKNNQLAVKINEVRALANTNTANIANKADINHDHDNVYATMMYTDSYYIKKSDLDTVIIPSLDVLYSNINHTHDNYALASDLDNKANINHNHDDVYANINHTHDDLIAKDNELLENINNEVTRAKEKENFINNKVDLEITNRQNADLELLEIINNKADVNHDHDGVYADADYVEQMIFALDYGKANASEVVHSGTFDDAINEVYRNIEFKANRTHTHDNYALASDLDNKAGVNHTHDNYALITNVYSKTEINTMLGNIESLLSNI